MEQENKYHVTLLQDEPWTVLDARRNPQPGRKLTYRLDDGTFIELDVTMQQYKDTEIVKALLQEEIDAHFRLMM